ncbi:MAG: hypothetical protein Q8Q09_06640 [Deltaproteobacteria bacterium]|nr:hypothetical protein [Deltaproteobacteria bacterium]
MSDKTDSEKPAATAERRVIVVGPEAQEPPSAAARAMVAYGLAPWVSLAPLVGPAVLGAAVAARALDRDKTVTSAVGRAVARGVSRWLPEGKARDAVERVAAAGARVLPMSEVVRAYAFPPGHPRVDHAYAVHPCQSARYIPVGAFHRVLFDEKVSELMTLLASLGAERVSLRAMQGYRESSGVSASVQVPMDPLHLGEHAGRAHREERMVQWEETFDVDLSREPSIPEGLHWFAHEPHWQALAQRRLAYGARSFRVALAYDEDFGVNASLALALEGLGLQLGGHLQRFERTRWEVEGTFSALSVRTTVTTSQNLLDPASDDPT